MTQFCIFGGLKCHSSFDEYLNSQVAGNKILYWFLNLSKITNSKYRYILYLPASKIDFYQFNTAGFYLIK